MIKLLMNQIWPDKYLILDPWLVDGKRHSNHLEFGFTLELGEIFELGLLNG